ADRIFVAEEVLRGGGAEDAHLRFDGLVVLGPHLAALELPASDEQIRNGRSDYVRRPVAIAVDRLRARAEHRRERLHAARLAHDGAAVVLAEALARPLRAVRARRRGVGRKDDDQVRPEVLELRAARVAR